MSVAEYWEKFTTLSRYAPDDVNTEVKASGIGIGGVLMKQGHPIAYFSKKLDGA